MIINEILFILKCPECHSVVFYYGLSFLGKPALIACRWEHVECSGPSAEADTAVCQAWP